MLVNMCDKSAMCAGLKVALSQWQRRPLPHLCRLQAHRSKGIQKIQHTSVLLVTASAVCAQL
jgi:hypothetical protein